MAAAVPSSPQTPTIATSSITHDSWNTAIIEYFTRNVQLGSPVYLRVDERALLAIRRTLLGQPDATQKGTINQFLGILRSWCKTPLSGNGKDMTLPSKPTHDGRGRPTCMVFLAAMVLAASYMEDDEDHSGQAYYLQLRDVLGLVVSNGRPPGLGNADELFWQRWNRWLETHGGQPTARQGEESRKYIEYPLSQCLLRRTDHQRLARLFRDADKIVDRSWNPHQFANHLPLLAQRLGATRLAGLLLDTSDPPRHEAILDDAYEVFRSPWYEVEDFNTFIVASSGPRTMEAGLYRRERDRRGNVDYLIYPRAPRYWQDGSLSVEIDGHCYDLKPERPGWFEPLPGLVHLGNRLSFKINGCSQELSQLVLPDSPFWIFVQDPDGYTNDMATWPTPCQDGEPFLLLAREELAKALATLRDQEFLRWQGDPVPTDFAGWSEYHDCQVCRFDWEDVPELPGAEALLRKLRPAGGTVRLSLEGGLSVPGQNVWLEGFPPAVCIRADAPTAHLRVLSLSKEGNPVVQEAEVTTHSPQGLNLSSAGDYSIEITVNLRGRASRFVRVVRWDQLEPSPVLRPCETPLEEGSLRGACVLPPQGE